MNWDGKSKRESSRYLPGRILGAIFIAIIFVILFGWISYVFEAFQDQEKAMGLIIFIGSVGLLITLFCWAYPKLKESLERNGNSKSFRATVKKVVFLVIEFMLGIFILYSACSVTNFNFGFKVW